MTLCFISYFELDVVGINYSDRCEIERNISFISEIYLYRLSSKRSHRAQPHHYNTNEVILSHDTQLHKGLATSEAISSFVSLTNPVLQCIPYGKHKMRLA